MTTAGGGLERRPDATDEANTTKPASGGQRQTDRLPPVTNHQLVNYKSQQDGEEFGQKISLIIHDNNNEEEEEEQEEEEDNDDEELLSEALLAVASAEEYAAKITKLQQACLTPLKEDLADWLNKILNTSQITTENFMDKLDNGVIICRLAKIISLWCEQQLTAETNNVRSTTNDKIADVENYEPPTPRPRLAPFANGNGPLRSTTSQSTNCLASASTTSLNYNGYSYHSNQFLNNLISMNHTKIWEDAKGRTFYARDNVCNFIKWSKEFGVNQSVLFESDDLVLHANARQVVLCLLDVARIAYVKYGFTEAPGLVKFEQEIDKELAAEKAETLNHYAHVSTDALPYMPQSSDKKSNDSAERQPSSRAKNSRGLSIGDATDELIMRYCKHKEEEAARKKIEELELAAAKLKADKMAAEAEVLTSNAELQKNESLCEKDNLDSTQDGDSHLFEADSLMPEARISSPTSDVTMHNSKNLVDMGRVDSLDSGEGPTESASTGHSSQMILKYEQQGASTAPAPGKRTHFSPSLISQQTLSMTNSEVSSSRSSLLSNQDGNNQSSSCFGRQITSDLDGKVMRIAKSYYGKGATKDVTRLSEGKYKIADRIVFVRLLKGHRVMVRIGGGWDTLENFLFRHKSDPSQVIDVDNLLPLETKMSFEKSPQVTPTNSRSSRLPYYRRSNSASSTNLSMSNLSVSNHSLSSNNTPSNRLEGEAISHSVSNSVDSTPDHHRKRQIPYLLIHKGQASNDNNMKLTSSHSAFYSNNESSQQDHRVTQTNSGSASFLRRPIYYQQQHQKITPYTNKFNHNHPQRPLASSRASTASATNLYPATLTTRLAPGSIKSMGAKLLNSTNNLHNNGRTPIIKQDNFRKFGRSNESLQASLYKSPQHRQLKLNGSSQQTNGNVGGRQRLVSHNN